MFVLLLSEIGEKVSLVGQLSYQIDVAAIREVAVKLQNIWMFVSCMKFDLSFDLLFQPLVHQELFVHGFDGDVKAYGYGMVTYLISFRGRQIPQRIYPTRVTRPSRSR